MREYLVCKIQYRDRDFIAAALYEDRKLVFLRMEPDGEPSLVGNVYRGVVDSVSRNIGGAFVDIGDRSLCFLPLKRHSHVQASSGILVQVVKDASGRKEPVLTDNIHISGKYAVLSMQASPAAYSTKLTAEEKRVLRKWMEDAGGPEGTGSLPYGVIVRTNAQAHRLTTLLQDISTLNRMDYARDMITMERVNVSELFADIAEETALAMQHRQITLHNYLPQSIIVQGNYSLLYSIFRNLMDNAINYAGKHVTIEVSAEQLPDCWSFTFKDNGIGIPAKHQNRIFERFYRIDKGRSRDMGGTGLGLSIVKNAVLLHGGNIMVGTPDTGGLAFEFTIKK